jgi:hypothetical protein
VKRALWTSLLLTVVLASGVLLRAVTFGEPDGTRHPYVGTIIFETATGGFYSCSGTLLSSTVFLTAGHCTEEAGEVNVNTWAKFTPTITFPGIATIRAWRRISTTRRTAG